MRAQFSTACALPSSAAAAPIATSTPIRVRCRGGEAPERVVGLEVTTNPGVRRWVLLALCTLGLFFICLQGYNDSHVNGDFGLTAEPTGTPFVDRLNVSPGGAADASGLRTGDLVDTRQITPAARFRLSFGARVGEPLDITVMRAGTTQHVTLLANRPGGLEWEYWLGYWGQAWIVLFCMLLAWRRPNSDEAGTLVLYLLSVFVISQGIGDVTTRWPLLDFIGVCVKGLIFAFGFAMVALYAACFGRPVSPLRRGLTVSAFVLAGLAAIIGFETRAALWNGTGDPFFAEQLLIRSEPAVRTLLTVLFLTIILSLVTALKVARGPERTRLLWGSACVVPFILWCVFLSATGALVSLSTFSIVGATFWFATPAILSYSLMNRQLLDIGFIVNRAAVFTTVSLVVLGAFVLVEWLLSDWLRDAGHVTNVLVSGAIALALGLSVRLLHTRIDRFVDNVFFRKRHEDEEAIRIFANEASYITDHTKLLERAAATLERYTDATSVQILLEYDENDPAVVRLRATPQTLDLHGTDSAIEGDVAFPMVARGRLVGIIVLGERRSGEAFAPDERAAISQLARSLAAALGVFSNGDGSSDGLQRVSEAIEALRSEIVRRLPDTKVLP
jgi:hypothetical protein